VLLAVVFAALAYFSPVDLPDELARLAPEGSVGEVWVDPAALSFESLPSWADPRWVQALDDTVAGLEPFAVSDEESLDTLGSELASFPFVARVEELRATRRHGLAVSIVLRRPVACLPAGAGYRLVSREGVVLPGRWDKPPLCEGGFLPVVGPKADAELLAYARPGDWLAQPSHLAALDVASSMLEHLDVRTRARLGRTRIDAERAGEASVTEPGIRIQLEQRRLVLFGRAPSTEEPGELPVSLKWQALARALERLDQEPRVDWDLVDCRWDQPDLRLVAAARGSAEGQRSRPRLDGGAESRRTDPPRRPRTGTARVR